MTIASWPDGVPAVPVASGWRETEVDGLARFEPSIGSDVTRPRTTAAVVQAEVTLPPMDPAKAPVLKSFFRDTLKHGSLPFVWRHPRTNDLHRWVFDGPPEYRPVGTIYDQPSFRLIRKPGDLWFAAYVPLHWIKVPKFVADYGESVFGVDGVKGSAVDLASVSGTYDVYIKATDGSRRIETLTYSGDVPQAQPSGIAWMAGFER